MSKIILVDPQDSNEKFWWIGIVVDPVDYELFFSEMVGKDEKIVKKENTRNIKASSVELDLQNDEKNDNIDETESSKNTSMNVSNNGIDDSMKVDVDGKNKLNIVCNNGEKQTNKTVCNKENKAKNGSNNIDENTYLVCYFEDGSFSTVSKGEVIELDCKSKPFTDWLKDKSFKNSKAVKNLYKFLDDKIPAKFKWLKKKRKINGEGMLKKKVWKKRADKFFGEKNEE